MQFTAPSSTFSALRKTPKAVARIASLAFMLIGYASAHADTPTISAPAQSGINETIEISVSGPEAKGDMIRFANAHGILRGGSYTYVGNIKNGTTSLSAPLEPGKYRVAYVSSGEIVASAPLVVVPVTAKLSGPENAAMASTISVSVAGPFNNGDQLFLLDDNGDKVRGFRAYVGAKTSVSLKLPPQPGNYQVGYFTATKLLGTMPITVTGTKATVSAPTTALANSTVSVSFEGPKNSGDYLQFIDASRQPVRGLYAYVGNAENGSVNVKAPLAAGSYEIGYFTSRTLIGSSPIEITSVSAELSAPASVAAGAHFTVLWTGPDNSGDQIAITDENGKNTGAYTYTGNHPESVTLRAPETPGLYSVVYRTGPDIIGETTFEVTPVTASLAAPEAVPGREHFIVTWQGPGNIGDQINMRANIAGELRAYRYVSTAQGQEARLLAPAEAGEYTLRYVTQGGGVLAEKAMSVTPPPRQPGFLKVQANAHHPLSPNDGIELVLDASGSMLQRIDGERRIEIAKRTLVSLVTQTLPPGSPLALRVFGHKEADKCRSDLEQPLAPLEQSSVSARIASINAMNLAKTPIADSLLATNSDLAGVKGERIIVLVTDGEETCGGDPAAVIASLRAAHESLRVNIIGFSIDDEKLHEAFTQWAALGGGGYFQAAEEAELSAALLSSISPAFSVHLPDGSLIEDGVAGETAITLAPGDYQVRSGGENIEVTINDNELSTVNLLPGA